MESFLEIVTDFNGIYFLAAIVVYRPPWVIGTLVLRHSSPGTTIDYEIN